MAKLDVCHNLLNLLFRFLPNLRRQLVVMLRTMDNVAVFFALLMLFIFIFRLVMNIAWNDVFENG
jgi:hypothetical protein